VPSLKKVCEYRQAPVKAFNGPILATCSNYLDLKARTLFLGDLGSSGGIYLIRYKHNPFVYYIGRTAEFRQRFNNHIKRAQLKDKGGKQTHSVCFPPSCLCCISGMRKF